jgi:hypothetical protein
MKRRDDRDVDHAKTRLTLKGIKTLFFFVVAINYSRNLAFARGGGILQSNPSPRKPKDECFLGVLL